jgi:hypothetical protein
MFFESGKDVKPHQGALVALRLAGDSLSSFPKCVDGKKILAAIAKLERPISRAQLVAFDTAIKRMRLPTQKQLDARSPVTSRVLRAARSFIQAILAEEQGKEVRAWRCVASCALDAGLCMAVAFEHERKRTAGSARAGTQGPLTAALALLITRGLTNSKIFAMLSLPEETEYDEAFPIDITEPIVSDWTDDRSTFHYVVRGENQARLVRVKTLKNQLSKLRPKTEKSRLARKSG